MSRNDWWAYRNVNLKNIDSITARVSSGSNNNGRIEFRIDSPTGPKIGEVTVPEHGRLRRLPDARPGGDQPIPGGTHTLYMVGQDDQAGDLLDLDTLRFNGRGVSTTPAHRRLGDAVDAARRRSPRR